MLAVGRSDVKKAMGVSSTLAPESAERLYILRGDLGTATTFLLNGKRIATRSFRNTDEICVWNSESGAPLLDRVLLAFHRVVSLILDQTTMRTKLPLIRHTRLLVFLVSELIVLILTGCATIPFQPANPAILAGKWKAIGPEFQDYYFEVSIVKQEPRLTGEPEARFKNEAAKAKYDKKYGYAIKTADAFVKAVNSLNSIAAIGGPTRTTVDLVDQSWDSARSELLWINRGYKVVNGKRDPSPIYEDEYKIDFESDHNGMMLFDGKNFELERIK